MSCFPSQEVAQGILEKAARLATKGRYGEQALDPHPVPPASQDSFDVPLPRNGRDPGEVIEALDRAARPGLSGMTQPGFMSWVIGGSHPVGVAADWMAAAWGQNACVYDASPAAAEAEAAGAKYLLDVLDLPRDSSVGFATGATMAAFTSLAAARLCVLERAGHDFERKGLCGCPEVAIYIADDAHVTNYSVLRYLGFGSNQMRRIPTRTDGTYDCDALERAMEKDTAPARIVLAQAGHIMSGAFDDFGRLAALCKRHDAWLHVDGAFGLWVRASRRLRHIAEGAELADSWSVDGHKWLQIPYDCGFAVIRHEEYHRRAMTMQAGYLPDGERRRNNSDYVPELSRRARGFAVWAVMHCLGRKGIEDMVESHCHAAHLLAQAIKRLDGVEVVNQQCLNQLAVAFECQSGDGAEAVAEALNASGRYFVRTASWRGRKLLRFSITNGDTGPDDIAPLVDQIIAAWQAVSLAAA
ncbi:pyridoxal phosphate-dependent decarboxylase family protein [Aurantiacibacter gilvus]|uniref:Pyridoxal-dependent decarboxylase n=1 Tax=Aurantiacibacter gilvus TaxID=3139141 RepID=A0ABU9IGH5_9SPHN